MKGLARHWVGQGEAEPDRRPPWVLLQYPTVPPFKELATFSAAIKAGWVGGNADDYAEEADRQRAVYATKVSLRQ